jgi:dCMP deaminase
MNKWDKRFLQVAALVASWSKDNSHQVGAVIVNSENRIVGIGYNGPPSGIDFVSDKKQNVLHAEVNAILNCILQPKNCAIYVHPFLPCVHCAAVIAQAGITKVVYETAAISSKWLPDDSHRIFKEKGIVVLTDG